MSERKTIRRKLKALRAPGKRTTTVVSNASGMIGGALVPGAGSVVRAAARSACERIIAVVTKSRDERLEELVLVVSGGRPEDFAAELEDAFLNRLPAADEFMEAARSAANACDASVVGAIGLLYVAYRSGQPTNFPRWKYRLYLQLLEELSGDEAGDLRALVHLEFRAGVTESEQSGGVPLGLYRTEHEEWRDLGTAYVGVAPPRQSRLCRLRTGARLFTVLAAHRLASLSDDDGISVHYDDLEPLAYAMPVPEPAST